MSVYTTELRFICENLCGYIDSQGLSKVEEIITKSAPLIFDFDYPIFDDDYKTPLERKIIRHFYLQEIGFETYGIFKLKLNDKLNEIMPYYNQLYKSELLKFNPLYDVDVKTTANTADSGQTDYTANDKKSTVETDSKVDTYSSAEYIAGSIDKSGSLNNDATSTIKIDGTVTNTAKSTNTGSTTDNSSTTKNYDDNDDYSDTPQGSVTNLDNLSYLSNARHKHGNSSDTTSGTGTSSGELSSNSTDTTKNSSSTAANNKQSTTDNETTTSDTTFNSNANSDATKNSNLTADTTSKTNTTNTQDYIQNIIGKRGSITYSQMLNEFRTTFLNIDKMILDELSDLFMTIY